MTDVFFHPNQPFGQLLGSIQSQTKAVMGAQNAFIFRMAILNEIVDMYENQKGKKIELHFETPTKFHFSVMVLDNARVCDFHDVLCRNLYISTKNTIFVVNGQKLDGTKTFSQLTDISKRTILIQMEINATFQSSFIYKAMSVCPTMFNSDFDKDFRNAKPVVKKRGGKDYTPPVGWIRYGLAIDQYGSDTNWIAKDGRPGEWMVAYHGTHQQFMDSIVQQGLHIGNRNAYGKGVYCTPNIATAEAYASTWTDDEGQEYTFAMMTRVNPKTITFCIEKDSSAPDDYWFSPPEGIRLYGVLMKQAS